jgi:hypothetical protein
MGKDEPRKPRVRDTDGHIDGSWFRNQVFYPAVKAAGITFKVTPKSMRDPPHPGSSPAAPTCRS